MIEPLDYIIKDDTVSLEERIIRCLTRADQRYQRFLSENQTVCTVSFKVGQKQFQLYTDEITHITLSEEAHKLKIHCTNKTIQVRATLSSIESQLPDSFFRISREVLINTHYVQEINWESGIVILSGGISYQVSFRKIAELKKRCRKN
jgi:DNA-binding LytR/AlgR family response regulator